MLSQLVRQIGLRSYKRRYEYFCHALSDVETAQRRCLKRLYPLFSYEKFREHFPVTTYADYGATFESCLQEKKEHGDTLRFIPTSGSTAQRKWIPFTRALREEFEHAAAAWVFDSVKKFPALRYGRHYWSLSWLPQELRSQPGVSNDDRLLFSPLRSWVWSRVMAAPAEIAYVETSELALVATAAYLVACRDLSLVSIWSPTFFLSILQILARQREEIAESLERGQWHASLGALQKNIRAPRCRSAAHLLRQWDGDISAKKIAAFWPQLTLLSAWDSSTSASWAEHLRHLFPRAAWQGKGLWATEGVVTIPFAGDHPLAITSHFLEFRCLSTGTIHPAWDLTKGQEVQPLLTTGGGLTRYELADRLVVSNFLEETPCLTFLGRLNDLDMVGEKLAASTAGDVRQIFLQAVPAGRFLGLFGVSLVGRGTPYYCLVAEGHLSVEQHKAMQHKVEEFLQRHHHYQLARELQQLGPVKILVTTNAFSRWEALSHHLGFVGGARKVDELALWKASIPPEEWF